MPTGVTRTRRIDGSTDHLLKPTCKQGSTRKISVPVVLADQLLEIAHRLDSGESLDLTRDKKPEGYSHPIDMTQDNKATSVSAPIDLTQDNKTEKEQIKAEGSQAIALLQKAITPRAKGGSYAANNATGIKRLVEQALALLRSE